MNIKNKRHLLHSLIIDALAGYPSINAADIHSFRTARFRNETPLHGFISLQKMQMPTDTDKRLVWLVQLLARFSNQTSELAAEDALDDMDTLLTEELLITQDTSDWQALIIADHQRSTADYDGTPYRVSQYIIVMGVS